MKILITGATGFVGKNCIPQFLKEHELYLLIRNLKKATEYFGDSVNYITLEDIRVFNNTKFDIVIHLAAFLSSSENDNSLEKLLESNIVFGTRLLNKLKQFPPRLFVNFGTFAEYRFGPSKVHNAYLYSATKSAYKEILRFYAEKYKFKYIHVIPYTIYGGKDSQKKVIDLLMDSTSSDSPVKMSGGEQILDFINVNDIVSFIIHVVDNCEYFIKEKFIDYHLGTGKGTSLRQLAKKIEAKTGKKCNVDWGAIPYRETDVMYAVAPQGPLIECGWKPTLNIEDSL